MTKKYSCDKLLAKRNKTPGDVVMENDQPWVAKTLLFFSLHKKN